MSPAVLLSFASWAIVASGPTPRRVVVLPAQVEGGAEMLGPALSDAARRAIADAGAEAVDPPPDCAEPSCAAEVAGPDGYILVTTATVDVSDFRVQTQLLDASANAVERTDDACDICTAEEAASRTGDSLRKALSPHAAIAGEDPAPDTNAAIAESVESNETAPKRGPDPKLLEGIGWGAVGVGAAAFVGGIVLLVLNDRPVKKNCDGANVDASGNCMFLWNTLGGGIGLTIGGALVAGGGAGLVVYSRRKHGKAQSDVAVSAGSVTVSF